MEAFDPPELKKLYVPPPTSHKGQNGKLMIVGGSHLFHGASLWALKVASRIVDMVFYSSVAENNEIAKELKSKLYDIIIVPREKIEEYIQEADCVLIGPGLAREGGRNPDEESTRELTKRLLLTYRNKKWVIDAGSLTEMEPGWLQRLHGNVVITPHKGEFEKLFNVTSNKLVSNKKNNLSPNNLLPIAHKYNCVILLKGQTDIVCSSKECIEVKGGNAGMTKGGTGDVLAGLVAALACKNDLFLAAGCASYINKKAGESLYKRVGPFFNASDLCDEIPKVMKTLLASV